MINGKFHFLLSELVVDEKPMTVGRLAKLALGSDSHSHLCQVLNNKPGRGGQTRKKVPRWFTQNFSEKAPAILEQLGWDAEGNVTRGTFHVEQKD